MSLEEITQKIIPTLQANDVEFAGVFGSAARGEGREDSDVDIVVRFSKRKGLIGLIGLERQISEALGKKAQVLTEQAIHPYIQKNVLKDLKIIYGQRSPNLQKTYLGRYRDA